MKRTLRGVLALAYLIGLGSGSACQGGERTERFDRDPGWEGRNNRSNGIPPRRDRVIPRSATSASTCPT